MSKRIIIIDDDEDDIEFFAEALKEFDPTCECTSFRNGAEVLEALVVPKAEVPDFIFLDLNMPRLNGKTCLVELRKMEKLSKTPIIIYSTSRRKEDATELLDLGATDFFSKPNRFSEVLQILSSVLTRD